MIMQRSKLIDGRMVLLLAVQVVLMTILGVILSFRFDKIKMEEVNTWSAIRDSANKLKMVGVSKEAALLYQKYLENAPLSMDEKSEIAYTIAELLEKEGMFEQALSYYYQVEGYNQSGKLVSDSKDRVVGILERLKKFGAVKYALKSATALDEENKPVVKSGDALIAKVGATSIYLHEVNEALDQLPPQYREQFNSKEKKIEFAKKYVVDEMMFKRAKRMNLDDDSELRKQMEQVHKTLLVQKIIKEEISGKVKIDEKDVENYFVAHQDDYSQKKSRRVEYIKVSGKNESDKLIEIIKTKKTFNEIAKDYRPQTGELFENEAFNSLPPSYLEGVWKTARGQWSSPVVSQGDYYHFFIKDEKEGKKFSFNEVKNQVATDYRMMKEQELYKNFIDDAMKSEEVQLFPERIL